MNTKFEEMHGYGVLSISELMIAAKIYSECNSLSLRNDALHYAIKKAITFEERLSVCICCIGTPLEAESLNWLSEIEPTSMQWYEACKEAESNTALEKLSIKGVLADSDMDDSRLLWLMNHSTSGNFMSAIMDKMKERYSKYINKDVDDVVTT